MFAGLNMRQPGRRAFYREDYLTAGGVNSKIVLPAPMASYSVAGSPLTIFKNGSLLFYGVDFTVSGRTVSLTSNTSIGDKYLVQLVSPVSPVGAAYFSGSATDPYFANVISLLHFDGTSGGTSFPDTISANSWTASNLTTNTSIKQYGTASGGFARASNSNLYLSTTTIGNLGSSDFTIECWVNPTTIATTAGNYNFLVCKDDISGGTRGWSITMSGDFSGHVRSNAFVAGTGYPIDSGVALSTGVWTHVAFCRQGQTCTLYIGGISKGTTSLPSPSSTISSPSYGLRLGSSSPSATGNAFDGYIDDFRLSVGVCRYTSNFTPTGPFPDHS